MHWVHLIWYILLFILTFLEFSFLLQLRRINYSPQDHKNWDNCQKYLIRDVERQCLKYFEAKKKKKQKKNNQKIQKRSVSLEILQTVIHLHILHTFVEIFFWMVDSSFVWFVSCFLTSLISFSWNKIHGNWKTWKKYVYMAQRGPRYLNNKVLRIETFQA